MCKHALPNKDYLFMMTSRHNSPRLHIWEHADVGTGFPGLSKQNTNLYVHVHVCSTTVASFPGSTTSIKKG